MSITQISKIQVKTGNVADVPQLDVGEFGWAIDDRKLYIGNDQSITPAPPAPTPNNTEILTELSSLAGGANTQVQYNKNGDLAGSPKFTFDDVSGNINLGGNINTQINGIYAIGNNTHRWEEIYLGNTIYINNSNITGFANTFIGMPNLDVGGNTITNQLYVETTADLVGNVSTGNLDVNGDVNIDGDDLTTTSTTFNILNSTATTINFGGAATTVEIGAATGTTNVNNNLVVDGDVQVKGGDITTNQTTFNIVTGTVTDLNIGTSATNIQIGSASGNTNVNNNLIVDGDASVLGNLNIQGNLSYLNIDTLRVEDPILELGGGPNGQPLTTDDTKDRGALLHYFRIFPTPTPIDAFMGWDNSNGEFAMGSKVTVSNEIVTFVEFGNLRIDTIKATDGEFYGNVNANNLNATNLVTGNLAVVGGIISNSSDFAGTVTVNALISNTSVITNTLAATGSISAASGTFTGNISANNITATNNFNASNLNVSTLSSTNLSVTDVTVSNNLSSLSGQITYFDTTIANIGSLTVFTNANIPTITATTINSTSGTFTGTINADAVSVTNTVSANNLSITESINANNISITNTVSANAGLITNINSTTINNSGLLTSSIGNISTVNGTIANFASGNVISNYSISNVITSSNIYGNAIYEKTGGINYQIVSRYDIGTDPNQIPLNQYLGDLAYFNKDSVIIDLLQINSNLVINDTIVTTSSTLNIGLSATTVEIGASTGNTNINNNLIVDNNLIVNGDLEVKGSDITTNQTSFNLLNITPTTIILGNAATTMDIGASSGNTNVNNNLIVDLDASILGQLKLTKTITTAGTTGNTTINNQAGSVNFATSATSLVVTNSLVNANSVIVTTVATSPTTVSSASAVAATGSFTLYPNVSPNVETRINWLVIN